MASKRPDQDIRIEGLLHVTMTPRLVDDAPPGYDAAKVAEQFVRDLAEARTVDPFRSDDPTAADNVLRQLWNALVPEWVASWLTPRAELAEAALRRRPVEGPRGWREVFTRIAHATACHDFATPEWALQAEGEQPETAELVLEGRFDAPAKGSADR
jgi:hypothetical protein